MDAKPQPAAGVEKETDDIYFSADEMIDNKDMQTITAVGDVNIIRKDQTLKADKAFTTRKTILSRPSATSASFRPTEPSFFPTMSNLTTK